MPGRIRIYLADVRRRVPPPVLKPAPPTAPLPGEKSMLEKWKEFKRGAQREEPKPEKENPGV